MNRRLFLTWVGVGGLASSLPVVLAACSPSAEDTTTEAPAATETPPESTEAAAENPESSSIRPDGFAVVGQVSDLDSVGFVSDKKFAGGRLVVIRSLDDPETLVALDATCPHARCTAEWEQDNAVFACPCHGSKFGPDGSVVAGPATEPLASFEAAKIEGDLVLVKAG
ncbi:MAG: Rieske (2Fe-2S) protein [Cyanothece sp. SIO1E1]|nr:Rieske (2Fe-2S) protein [Cyanothece sp. SIO1E1]